MSARRASADGDGEGVQVGVGGERDEPHLLGWVQRHRGVVDADRVAGVRSRPVAATQQQAAEGRRRARQDLKPPAAQVQAPSGVKVKLK